MSHVTYIRTNTHCKNNTDYVQIAERLDNKEDEKKSYIPKDSEDSVSL